MKNIKQLNKMCHRDSQVASIKSLFLEWYGIRFDCGIIFNPIPPFIPLWKLIYARTHATAWNFSAGEIVLSLLFLPFPCWVSFFLSSSFFYVCVCIENTRYTIIFLTRTIEYGMIKDRTTEPNIKIYPAPNGTVLQW